MGLGTKDSTQAFKLGLAIDPTWEMQKKIYYIRDDFRQKTAEIKEYRR